MKKLSIIIPVYNIEKYIIECLKSIDVYNESEVEVIIVNDGSTDSSEKMILEYIVDKAAFKYIYQANKGLSGARNTGIKASRGEYLFFLDGDDKLCKNAIENLMKSGILNSPTEIIISRYKEFSDIDNHITEGPDLEVLSYDRPFDFYDTFVNKGKNWISAWSCIVKRSFILNNDLLFKEEILHEDELWVLQIFAKANKLKLNNNLIYQYRTNRKGSIMENITSKHLLDKLNICNEVYSIVTPDNRHIINSRIRSLMLSVILSLIYLDDEQVIKEIEARFWDTRKYLKTREGLSLYLCSCFGLHPLVRIVRILRRR
uniref:glycosyltransferase family 2 protein n=1 Tax=Lachnoclostridium phocaeense TaxID=1871021 RepID=UPI0026DB355F|nr:glycosyltransferase family 2 protein [Lachnoclostridium phocaeense]